MTYAYDSIGIDRVIILLRVEWCNFILFDRFPVNEIRKKKWMEMIGAENINPRHKMWYVCSLHFDESCFNKTLDVIRLHDGAVPSMLVGFCYQCNIKI